MDKNVTLESIQLTDAQFNMLEIMYSKCLICKKDFYHRFGGIRSISKIQSAWDLRNELRPLKLEDKYQISQRLWIMLLFDVCANLKSIWSNLANFLKTKVRENDNLSDNDKAYLYYVLSSHKIWAQILNRQDILKTFKLKFYG